MNRIVDLKPNQNTLAGNYRRGDVVLVKCDATTSAFSVLIPDAKSVRDVIFYIKKTDSTSNVVTLTAYSTQTFDGDSTIAINSQYDSVGLVSDYNIYYKIDFFVDEGDYLLRDGSRELTAPWDAGPYKITCEELAIDGLTSNSVPFVGSGGLLSEDNSNLTWDNSTKSLTVNTGNILLGDGYVDSKDYYYIDGDKIISVDGVDNMYFGKNSGRDSVNATNCATLGVGALADNINGIQDLAIGTNALSKTKSNNCVGVGVSAARNNVLGTSIIAIATNALFTHAPATATSAIVSIGASCFYYDTTGYRHSGIGTSAGFYQQTGHGDSYFGYEAGRGLTFYSASYSTISGYRAAYGIATGADYNAIYGANSGYNIGGATRCCFFGPFSGYYETDSNKLFIDNQIRTDEATSRVESLIYGIFNATTANQEFHVNGKSYFLEDMLIRGSSKNLFRDSAIGIYSQADTFLDMFADGAVRIGDSSAGAPTNYTNINSTGDVSFNGTARIDWAKTTAASVTITVGGTDASSVVANLQSANDGNVFHLDEVAASPAIDMYVEFTSVKAFSWVKVLAQYDGSTAHDLTIQIYNWSGTNWETYSGLPSMQYDTTPNPTFNNGDFFVPNDTPYIGTDGDAEKVRVRLVHFTNGNASHDLYIDVVALYQ